MKNKLQKNSINKIPIHWVLPALFILIAIFILPVLDVFKTSFTNQKIGISEYSYTLNSYKEIFTSASFWSSLGRTLVFVFFSVAFQVILGLAIAISVDEGEKLKIRGTVFVRTVSLISMVIPGVIIGIIWKIMYQESANGILNYFLSFFNVSTVKFLSDTSLTMASAVVANVWRGTASSMILLYAAIKTIPNDIIEASKVDGANVFQRFFTIKLPTIANMLLIVIILNVIGTFNTFDMIMTLTGGGPGRTTEVLALSVYREVFLNLNIAKGSGVAIILLGINMVMAVIYFRMQKKVEV
ncbi:MAG: carbohydrate ABC transporter permease [Pleomorphochaeta sp.]